MVLPLPQDNYGRARYIPYLLKTSDETNKELHWSSYTRLRNAVSMKLRKEKASYYLNQLRENQDSRKF